MRRRTIASSVCWIACLLLGPMIAKAETPHWIWHDNKGVAIQPNETRFFRKTFSVSGKPTKAILKAAADDDAVIYINGKRVAHPKDYAKPAYEDITSQIRKGENIIAVQGKNIATDKAGVL